MTSASTTDVVLPEGGWRELLSVATPLMLSQGSLSFMYVIDRIFLTWYSPDALAAALPTTAMHWMFMSLAFGTAGYVSTFVAQYHGAGRPERLAAAVWQGVWFTLLAAGAMLALAALGGPLFRFIHHSPQVQRLEQEFFRILCLGAAPFVLSATLAGFYSGRGKTLVVLIANVLTCSTTVLFDYLFIFGWHGIPPEGMAGSPGYPEAGVRGAAWASVTASCVGVLFYICLMLFGRDGRSYRLAAHWRFDRELFFRLLRFGSPAGVQMFFEVGLFSVFLVIAGRLGDDALRATNITFNLESMAFVPMLGLAAAVSTLVGRRIGEGRPELATRTVLKAHLMTGVYMAFWGGMFLFAPMLLLAPYGLQRPGGGLEQVYEKVPVLLRFVTVYLLFDGTSLVYGAAVRGAGDTRFPLLYNLACGFWFLATPSVLIYRFGFLSGDWSESSALLGCWSAVCVYVVFMGVGMAWRFRRGDWRKMRVIEAVQPTTPLPVKEIPVARRQATSPG